MTGPSWKRAVAHAFDAAAGYDGAAVIQAGVAESLAAAIAGQALAPAPRVLEIGCGTGFLTEALGARLAVGPMLATDVAPAMLARCRARMGGDARLRYLVMDGERPCLAPGFDLIASSLAAQWFEDLPRALGGLAGLLAPGGLLAVATLTAGTFREWRRAHEAAGWPAATPDYPSADTLRGLSFPGCVTALSLACVVEAHADGRAFLKALRAIGAQTPAVRPAPPHVLRRVLRHFDEGGARVTYAVATCLIRRT